MWSVCISDFLTFPHVPVAAIHPVPQLYLGYDIYDAFFFPLFFMQKKNILKIFVGKCSISVQFFNQFNLVFLFFFILK